MAKIIGILLLLFAVGFNLWTYRLEPTALLDPNDNTFQYALVNRTNQIWDYALKTRNFLLLIDHWVPNWAQGYNLPYYYSHVPQIFVVALWRLTRIGTLFQFYHWVIYLLLCFFPISLFVALRIIGVSWLSAGFGALIASHLSTDGLYGLDPASFLWRGYGLSSQLFAMIWLPLALAYAYRGRVLPTILFLAATTAGHLGIGIIAFMSVAVVGIKHVKKLPLIYGGVGLLLGYWILPILLGGNYHNTSVWDPIWKFDSYGYAEVLKNLFNGDLFDFGRLPILTLFVFVGLFRLQPFSLLFIFWLLMYFGRATWGSLIDLIPGMSDFHLSRFIVGVHIAGLFLIPIGFEWILSKTKLILCVSLVPFVLFVVYPQTLRYATHNDFLINRANTDFTKISADTNSLLLTVNSLLLKHPGRVYFGRGGNWGKNFKVAETPYYLYGSTFGIPTILWLPQTWSPNSDTEQFFSDDKLADYTLYNVRYVVTPLNLPKDQIRDFWAPLATGKTWRLYSVDVPGYITTGIRPAIVSSAKENFTNLIHLWITSDYPQQNLYPQLTFSPVLSQLPRFSMLDEVTYRVPDGSLHNLFAEVPRYLPPTSLSSQSSPSTPTLLSQSSDSDMVFRATVEVPKNCTECLVILKQTFHPSWRATVDGKSVDTMTVFPFYTAVNVNSPGKHDVVFSYEPSGIKKALLLVSFVSLILMVWRLPKFPKFLTKWS